MTIRLRNAGRSRVELLAVAGWLSVAACSPEASGAGQPTSSPAPTAAGSAGSSAPSNTPVSAGTPVAAMPSAPLSNLSSTPPSGAADSGGDVPNAEPTLPCDVATVVAQKCATCHGEEPIGGAPMALVKPSDFTKSIMSIRTSPGMTEQVASLVKKRIQDESMPMPPGSLLPENERAALSAWIDAGMPPGTDSASCVQPTAADTVDAKPPTAATMRVADDGSVCYQMRNHGQPEPSDTTKYSVPPGEQYVSFYFKAPWTEASEIVSFNTLYDNKKILHHWLLYTTLGADMDGTFAPGIGTHIGDAAQLLAGWAVGGNDVELPQDVALRLPPPGSGVMIEWHFYNAGLETEMDGSAVEICLQPQGTRANTAGMTWLGTENFNGPIGMPARQTSEYGGTCLPSRTGMNAVDPIHIFTLWPHMHQYGRTMRSVVTRADGTQEEVFNKPFDFNYQITYDVDIDLYPGDVITSTCTFENTSDFSVPFGPSSDQEMCYQFAYSYPAGALDNGVPSLVGATNTCW